MASSKSRLVVAAVIGDEHGRFLLARRPLTSHLGGLWEFPGGGVEDGEEPAEALVRELREELGVEAEVEKPLTFAWHRDEQRSVLLLFYRVRLRSGRPEGREGQEVGWFAREQLTQLPIPPADRELVRLLLGG